MLREFKEAAVRPFTFDNFVVALMLWHKWSIECKFSEHCYEFAGPAVKNHPNSTVDAVRHKNAAGSNGFSSLVA